MPGFLSAPRTTPATVRARTLSSHETWLFPGQLFRAERHHRINDHAMVRVDGPDARNVAPMEYPMTNEPFVPRIALPRRQSRGGSRAATERTASDSGQTPTPRVTFHATDGATRSDAKRRCTGTSFSLLEVLLRGGIGMRFLLHTLAASFIWGMNTLVLLDAVRPTGYVKVGVRLRCPEALAAA